jgi:hypothetical protein
MFIPASTAAAQSVTEIQDLTRRIATAEDKAIDPETGRLTGFSAKVTELYNERQDAIVRAMGNALTIPMIQWAMETA